MTNNTAVVVYDQQGHVVHISDWSAFDGELPSNSRMESEAIEIAVHGSGRPGSEFSALITDAKCLAGNTPYKVDVKSKTVVSNGAARKSAVVVYDKEGRIVHVYNWAAFDGSVPSAAQMESEAMEIAALATSKPLSELSALHTDAEHLEENKVYGVDVQKKALIAMTPDRKGR
jgi:DNA/RNA-binding domain of Phe-tRNA-synthetase-like protein